MFKFSSKNEELLATVDKQKEQIQRYEARLRDIVQAYKSLQKEKDALENSMKALVAATPSPSLERKRRSSIDKAIDDRGDQSSTISEQQSDDQKSDTDHDGDEEGGLDSNIDQLRSQVYTLTTSLSTVTEEKAKMVAAYQAEKKKFKHEQETQTKMLKEQNEVLSKKSELLESELDKVREKVRGEQMDREQEQATHSIMLREIQRMLNDERTKNENFEAVIKELRSEVHNADTEAQHNEDYKRRVRQLEDELSDVRTRLKYAEVEANTPSPLLLQLQEEMDKMKREHAIQLQLERTRVDEVEQRERETARSEEERVADLESRLVQISNKLGMYDGSRQKDQLSIQKLKDRIAQLDVENALLNKQLDATKTVRPDELSMSALKLRLEEGLDIDGLKEHVIKFQQLLKEAAQKSNEPVDLSDVVMSFQSDDEEYRKLYLDSQQELLQLKEEFERYKTRAQNVLKNMKGPQGSASGATSNREMEEAKRQLQEARERHFHLRARCDDLETKLTNLVADHERELNKMAAVHSSELEREREAHTRRVSEVERDKRVQRERTVAMLADKDKEIKQLKAYTNACHSEYQIASVHSVDDYNRRSPTAQDELQDPMEESVAEIVSNNTAIESNMIHYVEQLARKDVIINSIRRHKKQLELQIRQLQDVNITKDEKNAVEVARLKEGMMEYERKTLRESANVEYLKNVMYQYLTTSDVTAKQRILTAIVTILQFSPEECRKSGVKTR